MSWRLAVNLSAVLAVNALLRLSSLYAMPDLGPAVLLLPVPELFGSLALYLLVRRWAPRRYARLAVVGGAVFLAVLTFFVLGEAFFLAVFRESFMPLEELRYLPPFLEMITGVRAFNSRTAAIALVAAVALVPAFLYALLFVATGRTVMRSESTTDDGVAKKMGARRVATSPTVVISILALGAVVASLFGRPFATATALASLRARPAIDRTFEVTAVTGGESESGWEWRDPSISILVLESYGHTLFSRADHRERIAPTYERLSAALQAGGVYVASGFLQSPAFGGRSWLADGTILSGRWLGNQHLYEAIIETDSSNLVRYLDERGYRSVLAAPAMTYFDEGWLDFYAFERTLVAGDYGYRGPVFDFGRLTDQYLLGYLAGEHGEVGDDRPRFLVAILVSTHVPFRVVPPYVDDWSKLGDGTIYHELGRTTFDNNWLSGGEYPEGYVASFEYTLQAVVDYILRFGGEEELFLVLGDHQPRIPISEQEATFSVPFHVLSRNGEFVRAFEVYGLESGFVPSQEPPHPRMDTVYPMVREVIEGSWRYRRDIAGAAYTRRNKQSW